MTSPADVMQPEGPNTVIIQAASAVGAALGRSHYAIMGGAACALLGSIRKTSDIDLVVVKGGTVSARSRLMNRSDFKVDPRTRHTHYRSDNDVPNEILTPPMLFKGEFSESTPTIEVDGVKVLEPTHLLNAKCGSIFSRTSQHGRFKDSEDIKFLLRLHVQKGLKIVPGSAESKRVPDINEDFVKEFVL